jgi:hypothetical protein
MITINKEQQVAGTLQIVNNILGVVAFIPAILCWLSTLITLREKSEYLIFLICSSVLLIVFYGYTIFGPRIYLFKRYHVNNSFFYWIIVILTNLFTAVLFASIPCWSLVIVPSIPFLIAIYGLIAHLKLCSKI